VTAPEELLCRARAETREQIAALTADFDAVVEASRGSNADDEHDPEGQTIGFERAQLASVLDQARTRLAELDAAVSRVADGSYGRCEVCGAPIGEARLQARPAARTCIAHA
jgi:RNA polymerase-binding transcription factor DksA